MSLFDRFGNYICGKCTCFRIKITVDGYSKSSKISNSFLVLFSNKMLVIKTGIHEMLVRIANREDPDQTAS